MKPSDSAAKERVLNACSFRPPDRIPRFDIFWEYPDTWRRRFGDPDKLSDILIWIPDETPLPSRARLLKEQDGWTCEVDGWGRTTRGRADAYFSETLAVPFPVGVDLASVQFDPPDLDERYLASHGSTAELQQSVQDAKRRHCVFAKTGGPFLRTVFMRGEAQFLMDMAGDPPLARALAEKVAAHLTAIGVEALRRLELQDTGIWIYDDMACNSGPMFSPATFERVLLPAYRSMIRAYKHAGARYVFLHCDGDVRPLLDMLIDAGIDGAHPLERRAGVHIAQVRRRHPRLILVGGMCNSDTLVNGPISRIEAEAREIIDLGRGGGVVIGSHSIGRDIPIEHYAAYDRVCRTYGDFSQAPSPRP